MYPTSSSQIVWLCIFLFNSPRVFYSVVCILGDAAFACLYNFYMFCFVYFSKILKEFLKTPNIFATQDFRELYEIQARDSIKQEIQQLES